MRIMSSKVPATLGDRHRPKFFSCLNPRDGKGAAPTAWLHITKQCGTGTQEKAVDLPVSVWANVGRFMSNKEWAKACGACAVSYQARMSLLVSEVCTDSGNDEHALMRQLQLKRWPTCRSFLLNLRNLHEGVKVTRSEIEQFKEAASAVPLLRCLHIIGRRNVPLTATSLEGVLMSCLAKHVSVLTLHVKSVMMSLDMPALRHLVFRGSISSQAGSEQSYEALFLALSGLKGLKTLYVHYHDLTVNTAVD